MPSSSELPVRVSPRASRTRLEVSEEGSVRAYVTAPPVDGEANQAVCELLAKTLGVAKSRVTIVAGHTSREKTLRVEGLDREELIARLSEATGQKRLPGT